MRQLEQIEYNKICGGLVFQDVTHILDGDTSNGSLSAGAIISYGGGRVVGTGALVGAVTGAAICTGATLGAGVPLVPYCAAVGAFIGNNVEASATSGPTGGNISDNPAA
jgi:hypothetical protein